MEFRILGPLEAISDGATLPLGGPKQRALLAELVLSANAVVSRDRLLDVIWDEAPPKTAVGTLQVYVHGLRRVLGADRIETTGSGYRLHAAPDELDLARFESLVEAGRRALEHGRAAEAVDRLDAALSLWRGPAPPLEERRLEAVEFRNDARLAAGRHDLVLAEVGAAIAEHPYRERLRAQQILALYRAGRQSDALDAYRAARDAWADELGIEPTPALRELERAVLRQDPALAPPVAASALPSGRGLPVPATPLVGRRLEVAAVAALLRSEARLVTLAGPGGIGKTRLAIAIAEELAPELRDGVAFVDLSAIDDPALLLPAVAEALGVDAGPDGLAAALRDRELLLVADNLEQLLPGAPRLSELLAAAPAVRILATSRALLRLSGEHAYPVGELGEDDAVELFTARARAAEPSFGSVGTEPAVAAICRRLDGLPLAIEIAAARVTLLSPAEILQRLELGPDRLGTGPRDSPARQSTLSSTIDWSYGLLARAERDAFARLSVFAGGCTVDAAHGVCDVELEQLEALVEQSLLQRRGGSGGTRLAMLETVRHYAQGRLGEDDADELRRRHAAWVLELAEAAEAELLGTRDAAVLLETLALEHDNIRAALGWALGARESEILLRLTSSLRPFWEVRGHLAEGAHLLDEAIETADARPTSLRAKAVGVSGSLAFHAGRVDHARERYREMFEIATELGDRDLVARALSDLGTVAAAVGDLEEAGRLLEDSADRFRELGERRRLAIVLGNLGHVAGQRGDYATASTVTAEALAVQEELGDEQHGAVSLLNLGGFALEQGDAATARERLAQAVSVAIRLGYKEVIAYALVKLARIALADGDPTRAARLAGLADSVVASSGVGLLEAEQARLAAAGEEARAALGDDAFAAAYEAGRTAPLEAALEG
ncbi:MAG TPA: BTAD domain-containing putative transcriptional regulator [Gaiellaceae bacterium]|nr:BTAD domain-containing putative transcriptional regulator [Gaiellaceae bacterium]